jgi:hypothetical protein
MIYPVPGRIFTPSSRSASDAQSMALAGRATVLNDSADTRSTTVTCESRASGAAESVGVSELPASRDVRAGATPGGAPHIIRRTANRRA